MVNNRSWWAAGAAGLVACLGLGGCVGDPPRTDVMQAVEGAVVLPTSLRVEDAALKVSAGSVFVSGDSRMDQRLRVTRGLPPGVDGRWMLKKVQVRDGQDDPETASALTMAVDAASGDLSLVQSVETGDDVLTIFEPPLVVVAGLMEPGFRRTQALRVTVHPLSDPTKIKAQGPSTHELSWVEAAQVRTPAGTFAAVHVRGVLTIDLDQAKVVNTTDQWFAMGVGLVAETRREQVTVLGLPIRNRSESWVLAE